MANLRGKTVLITGASSGIGKATATAFAREGARVLICSRRLAPLEDLVRDLISTGAESAYAFTLDVSNRVSVERTLPDLPNEWRDVDILVNNAGLEGSVIVQELRARHKTDPNIGFNVMSETYGDLIQMGIIDPAKVTRSAIENAASVAALLLTTEAIVAEELLAQPGAIIAPGFGDLAEGLARPSSPV